MTLFGRHTLLATSASAGLDPHYRRSSSIFTAKLFTLFVPEDWIGGNDVNV